MQRSRENWPMDRKSNRNIKSRVIHHSTKYYNKNWIWFNLHEDGSVERHEENKFSSDYYFIINLTKLYKKIFLMILNSTELHCKPTILIFSLAEFAMFPKICVKMEIIGPKCWLSDQLTDTTSLFPFQPKSTSSEIEPMSQTVYFFELI